MLRRTSFTVFMVCVCTGLGVNAGPVYDYKITIGGIVTHSALPDVSVGDPLTIQILADSRDRRPDDPARGSYRASLQSIAYPSRTATMDGFPATLGVSLMNSLGSDGVSIIW